MVFVAAQKLFGIAWVWLVWWKVRSTFCLGLSARFSGEATVLPGDVDATATLVCSCSLSVWYLHKDQNQELPQPFQCILLWFLCRFYASFTNVANLHDGERDQWIPCWITDIELAKTDIYLKMFLSLLTQLKASYKVYKYRSFTEKSNLSRSQDGFISALTERALFAVVTQVGRMSQKPDILMSKYDHKRNKFYFNNLLSSIQFASDVDECMVGKHNCDGKCQNTIGSYRCLCSVGYKLGADGRTCEGNKLNYISFNKNFLEHKVIELGILITLVPMARFQGRY